MITAFIVSCKHLCDYLIFWALYSVKLCCSDKSFYYSFRPFNPSLRPMNRPLSYPLPHAPFASSSATVGSARSIHSVGGNKNVRKSQAEKKSENPRETEEKTLVLQCT